MLRQKWTVVDHRSKQSPSHIQKQENPKRKRKNEESLHQRALFKWLALYDSDIYAVTFSIPNGGSRNKLEAKRLKEEGTKRGVPDIFMAIPNSYFSGLFIEMKSPKGIISKEQKIMIDKLSNLNYQVSVCRSWIEAKDDIISYLGRK